MNKNKFVDTTSILATSYAFISYNETRFAGMSVGESLRSRGLGACLAYLIVGEVFSKGRDYLKNRLRITDKTNEIIQTSFDSLYNGIFASVYAPTLNLIVGASFEEAKLNIIPSFIMGSVLGPLTGYIMDVGRDLTGLEECDRKIYPSIIKNRSKKTKSWLAKGVLASVIGVMGLIYATAPEKDEDQINISLEDRVFDKD